MTTKTEEGEKNIFCQCILKGQAIRIQGFPKDQQHGFTPINQPQKKKKTLPGELKIGY